MRNIPDFGQFKTFYGMRLFADFLQAAKGASVPLPLLENLYTKVLQAMDDKGQVPDEYRISDGSRTYSAEDLTKLFTENVESLRLHVVRSFEDFFVEGTEPEQFLSRYRQGDAQARKVFAYTSFFPVEAASVRAEMHIPSYARRTAMSEDVGLLLTRVFSDQNGNQFGFVAARGPVARIQPENTVRLIGEAWPDLDRRLIRGDAFEAAPSPNKLN